MIEYLCTCDGLPAHGHRPTGRTVPGSVIERGPFAGGRFERIEYDPFDIHLSVDWRAVAKALLAETA